MTGFNLCLGDVLSPAKCDRAGKKQLPILSMTMKDGLIDQEKKFNKRIASTNTGQYKIVKRNQLVVGFPIDEGVLAFQQLYDEALVSPAYDIWNIRPSVSIIPRYLQIFLRSPRAINFYLSKMQGSTARRRTLPDDIFLSLKVPIPALENQQRTIFLFDYADELKRKRREAVILTEDLLHAVFLEMFGDPIYNPKNWPTFEGGNVFARLDYGTSQKCVENQDKDSLPVLRIPNIVGGRISMQDLKFALLPKSEKEKCLLSEGDMLFVRTNGNPENIGRCAVFMGTQEVLFASYLIRGRLQPKSPFVPLFLKELFSYPTFRRQFVAAARTTAGNYNISAERIRGLNVIAPPKLLQEEFEMLSNQIWKLRTMEIEAQRESEKLFFSVYQKAFRGDL